MKPRIKDNPIYGRWALMKNRCSNQNADNFYRYGGRGIKVCERWELFSNFYDDMGPTFKPGLTLDRINNDGDYCPENCRWSNAIEQQRNTKRNHRLTLGDLNLTLIEWSLKTGIKENTIRGRLKRGWTILNALTTPV